MRAYLTKASYQLVYDCLEFAPYSEIVAILAREGLIGEVQRIKIAKPLRLPPP
jgi:hypothetical protein